jgi:Tfp pilus assembly protein PilF
VKDHLILLKVCAVLCLLSVSLPAQTGTSTDAASGAPSDGFGATNPYSLVQTHWIVAGKVTNLQGDPIPGAKVEVEPVNASGEFHTIQTDFQGQFHTEYWLNSDLTRDLRVSVAASKKGFLKAHQTVHFTNADKPWLIPVTLREPREDPALLSQEDLIFSVGPKLRNLTAADGLSAKSEKDYERGVADFLDRNRPERALPSFSKVLDRDPGCVGCRILMALAELASGDWDGAARDAGEAVTSTLKDRAHGRAEPLVVYGVMDTWRHDNDQATAYFLEALKFAPQDPLALQEIGRTQMLGQDWAMADSYLTRAIAAGAGPDSRLMRVEALLGEDNSQEASAEFDRYLNGRSVAQMPVRVRQLWLQVRDKKRIETVYLKKDAKIQHRLDYLRDLPSDVGGVEPASSQDELGAVLGAVGKNVADYFQNFPNTSSLEQVHQQKLRKGDRLAGTVDQKYHYLCVAPVDSFGPGFQEYRVSLGDNPGQEALKEGFMLTSGFASASLIFHPAYQPQSTFRLVGRQKIDGHEAVLIAFAQKPDKARVNGLFKSGDVTMPTFTQGLAWVDAGKFQILRLRTDLLTPLLDVKLERQTTDINFDETHFKGLPNGFWLPREVSVAVDWNGKRLRNQHQYSDFKLFSVGSVEKRGKMKNVSAASTDASTQAP